MFKILLFITAFMLINPDTLLIGQVNNPLGYSSKILNHHSGLLPQAAADSIQTEWVRQYISGYEPAFDFAYAIAVDGSGNVIVSGSSYADNELPDFATIKYNSSGDTLWVRRYNGPGNNWDAPRALVVDASGNIYVTGQSYSDSTYFNYVTIKYDPAGTQLWAVQYDGSSNSDDGAEGITVDASGNVYVTGHSWQSGTSWDYTTIKYNSSGQQIWAVHYNGPGNIADFAFGIALDPLGNVYVTGTADDLSVTVFPTYATIKYDSSGVQQWASLYRELWSYAHAIAVDNSGSAYVTGRSYALGTGYDYATVKYNTAGVLQWIGRYNGPGTSDDYALDLTMDGLGNVYVTGEAFFEADSGSDYATIKYSSSGTEQWVARYNGQGSSVDVANAVITDGSGNVYITGESRNSSGDDDFATIKYDADGIQQWVVRYDGQGGTFDLASALAADESGNVYVTGRSNQLGSSIITTIKYADVPVPVELISFAADVNKNLVTLNWTTGSELNNRGFEIEKQVQSSYSASGEWKKIGFVNGRGTTTETSSYSFTDEADAGKYYYRLKQVDFVGTSVYSYIIEAEVGQPEKFSLSQNYPNPFNPITVIKYSVPEAAGIKLTVYDILGNEVEVCVNEVKQPGNYEVTFNGLYLSSGFYIFQLKAGEFVESKRMMLLK